MSIFDLITSPLGLPISPLYEWIILLVVGSIAYHAAFSFVGSLDLHNGGVMSIIHWVIRLAVYVIVWFILYHIIEFLQLIDLIKS